MDHGINQPNINKHLAQIRNLTLKSLAELKANGMVFDGHFESEFLRLTSDSVAQTYRDFLNDGQRDAGLVTSNGLSIDVETNGSWLRSNMPPSLSVTSKFACVTCQDARTPTQYGSIDDIYTHWKSEHIDQEPFQFYVAEPVSHFHQNTPVVGSASRVLLIVSQLDQEIGYIRSKHQEVLRCETISPFRLTDERLKELLQINFRQDSTNPEANNESATSSKTSIIGQDEPKPSPILYVVCSYCKSQIGCEKYLLHVREHLCNMCCLECGHRIGTLADVFLHDAKVHGINRIEMHLSEFVTQSQQAFQNSKVVFDNGLVLYNLNLVGTVYDRSSDHSVFIQVLIDLEKAKYRNLCQPKGLDSGSTTENTYAEVSQHVNLEVQHEVNANQLDSNRQVLRSIENSPSVSSHFSSYSMELQTQNEYNKNLMISGIPKLANENLTAIFMTLCKKVNAKINADDILGIERCGTRRNKIIVKFKHLKEKTTIRKRSKGLWSNDFIKLPPKVPRTKVFVYPQLTPFFNEIVKTAKSAHAQGRLYSYELSKDGVIVKRTPESKGQIVLSKEQLENYL